METSSITYDNQKLFWSAFNKALKEAPKLATTKASSSYMKKDIGFIWNPMQSDSTLALTPSTPSTTTPATPTDFETTEEIIQWLDTAESSQAVELRRKINYEITKPFLVTLPAYLLKKQLGFAIDPFLKTTGGAQGFSVVPIREVYPSIPQKYRGCGTYLAQEYDQEYAAIVQSYLCDPIPLQLQLLETYDRPFKATSRVIVAIVRKLVQQGLWTSAEWPFGCPLKRTADSQLCLECRYFKSPCDYYNEYLALILPEEVQVWQP